MNLNKLIKTLTLINDSLKNESIKAVNLYLTVRNWYFGYYIFEFEQNGSDRAEYGKRILKEIFVNMKRNNISNCDERELRRYRQFYQVYPFFYSYITEKFEIRGTASPELKNDQDHFRSLFTKLSYSHLNELMHLSDLEKRYFYAIGIFARAGRYGGTYAHKDIAFEFGSWLNPEFKLYLIKEFQRLKNEENSKLKLEWNLQRTLAKVNYHIHTDAIKEKLIPKKVKKQQISFIYANEADMLNVALFGMTAGEWRKSNVFFNIE